MLMLHGSTGTSRNNYAEELAGALAHAGINVVVFNHFAPADERELRLMNMCENKYMDEVIDFCQKKFPDSELYLSGFSIGGNLILRYMG